MLLLYYLPKLTTFICWSTCMDITVYDAVSHSGIIKGNHTIIRAEFVCLFVCSLSPPRSFEGSSPNLVGVWRWTSELPLRGSFSKRSTARQVNGSLSLSTILYMHQPHATRCNSSSCLQLQESNSAPFARRVLHCISTVYIGGPWGVLFLKGQWVKRLDGRRVKRLDGVCSWTSQLPLRASFSKRSTGQRLNESNGSTGHFHFHYIIYDSRRHQAHAKSTRRMMTPGSRHTSTGKFN